MTPRETPRCEIAVIVPVHNAAAFLPDCLDSIAAQRFDDFCCILDLPMTPLSSAMKLPRTTAVLW